MDDPLLLPPEASPEPKTFFANFFSNPSFPFGFLRFCIFVALSLGCTTVLVTPLKFLGGFGTQTNPHNLLIGEATLLVGVYAAAFLLARWEQRPIGAYGLPLREGFGKLFWQGALFGFLEMSAVISVLAFSGAYHFGSIALHGGEIVRWGIFWAGFFLIVGFYEEFFFRGYPQFTFAQGIGFWPAAVLLSLLFGLAHAFNPGETWSGLVGVVLSGLLWCFTLQRTGSLWFAVGMHASFDFAETFLYSVPDSGSVFPGHLSNATLATTPSWLTGGSAGPEASIADFVVLLLLFYVFHRLYPAKSSNQIGNKN